MNLVKISPCFLNGEIPIPPSKSLTHRAIICSLLASKTSKIFPVIQSDDITATINAIKQIGAQTFVSENQLTVNPTYQSFNKNIIINCNESGSTLRFLIPIVAALGISATFIGSGNLPYRPLDPYLKILPKMGIKIASNGGLPLEMSGKLQPGRFILPGNISSQFISGLLMALPLLNEDSEVLLSSPLESQSYVDLTIQTIKSFGVKIEGFNNKNSWYIKGNQTYKPCKYKIESDWSQAAFFIAAGALSGNIIIKDINKNSAQGDKDAINLFSQFGADIKWSGSSLIIHPSKLKGINVDAKDIPDLVPILAVTAAVAEGPTHITGVERLKLKESNRLEAIINGLKTLGADIHEVNNTLIIHGVKKLKGGQVEGYHDHRIVMAFAIASLVCEHDITITDAQSVKKSYPRFFNDFNSLGGKANVIDNW